MGVTSIRKFSRVMTANQVLNINASGTSIRCIAGSATFTVSPANRNPVEMENGIGLTFQGEPVDRWEIVNGATAQTIELYIGDGEIFDSRVAGSITATLVASANSSYGAVTIGTSAAVILAANADRVNLLIQNLGTVPIYIGNDASVLTTTGIELAANASIVVTTDDDIYGISGTAGQDIRYFEETT